MDRRTVWAILLMMVIAIVPAIFIKRPPPAPTAADSTARDSLAPAPAPQAPSRAYAAPPAAAGRADSAAASSGVTPAAPAAPRTVTASSPLYSYGVSTTGLVHLGGRAANLNPRSLVNARHLIQ